MSHTPVTLILGGTSGLGKSLAGELSRIEEVLVIGRRGNLSCDLASETSTRDLIRQFELLKHSGKNITSFYWVAALLTRRPFTELSPEDILEMMDVNLRNPLLIANWVWRHMQSLDTNCRFCIISSTVGISDTPREDEAVYAATKASQVTLARALGKNNSNSRLKVSLFCPGGMKTGLWTSNTVDPKAYQSFMDPDKVAAHILLKQEEQKEPYLEVVIPRGSI